MKIVLLTFGKLKTPGLKEAFQYYQKLASSFIDFQEIELKPISVPDKSSATRLQIQAKEEILLIDRLQKNFGKSPYHFYLFDELGNSKNTKQWSYFFKTLEDQSLSNIAFCIGSSLGFSESVKQKANGLLSLGPQTLSHELARVILMEQLFRSWSYLKGHPYHNEG